MCNYYNTPFILAIALSMLAKTQQVLAAHRNDLRGLEPSKNNCEVADIVGKYEFYDHLFALTDNVGNIVVTENLTAYFIFEQVAGYEDKDILTYRQCQPHFGNQVDSGFLAPTGYFQHKITFRLNKWSDVGTNVQKDLVDSLANDYIITGEYYCQEERMMVSFQSYHAGTAGTDICPKNNSLNLGPDACLL